MVDLSLSVFISHSVGPDELPVVNQLSAALTGAGLNAYLAIHHRMPGIDLSLKVQSAISASDILVALITKRGKDSEWVQQEVGFALGQSKTVIPLVQKGLKPGAMLQGREYVEFDPDEPAEKLGNLASSIAQLQLQRDLALARAQAAQAQAVAREAQIRADEAQAMVGAIVAIGLLIILIWALSRK